MNTPTSTSDGPARQRPSWGWVLIVMAIAAFAMYAVRSFQRTPSAPDLITSTPSPGEILPDLEPSDRIELPSGAAAGSNVLVITMDTTRADHLGCYGNTKIRTPVIDQIARNGVLFANSFTSSPSTLPGHSTIFTGLYPYHHGARANGTYKLGPENTTLAEILGANGYATGAFIAAYVLDGRFGLDQGFDVYDDDLTKGVKYSDHGFRERPAQYVNEAALAWLETVGDQKFFAWVHYFDPHAPYLPPEPFRSAYAGNPYDGEIAYTDYCIGALLGGLAKLDKLKDTLIVIVADHGEGLGEHGEQTHSLLVYDSTLHTPMVICPPASRSAPLGSVVDRQVGNVDLVPTIVDALGIETDASFDGSSLLAGPETHDEEIYAETISTLVLHGWSPLFAIRRQDDKYIHAPRPELYDVANDPGELENILDDRAETTVELSRVLDEHIGKDLFGADALAQQVEMDPETARKLGALGYVGSVGDDAVDPDDAMLRDPKDMVPHFERVQAAVNIMALGRFTDAVSELEACVELVPEDVWAMRLLASAYLNKGDIDAAETMATRVLELEKNSPSVYTILGQVQMRRGNAAEAETFFRRALELDDEFAQAYIALGTLAAQNGSPDDARVFFERAIEMDPGSAGPAAYCAIGQLHLANLELEDARAAYDKAVEIDPLNGAAHAGLAAVFIEEGKTDEARSELDLATRFMPNDAMTLANRAGILNMSGEHEEASAMARRALDVDPDSPRALNALGSALRGSGQLVEARSTLDENLERHPRYVASIVNLALVALAEGREEEAAELYQRALAVNPNEPIALCNLGTYKISRGRHEEALALYRRAVVASPDYALAHRQLGMLLLTQNDVDAALTHLERSLELDTDPPDRASVVETIRVLRAQQADRDGQGGDR